VLKSAHSCFASYRREIVEKIVQRLATLKVVKQRLEWDPSTAEYGSASEYLVITGDDVF